MSARMRPFARRILVWVVIVGLNASLALPDQRGGVASTVHNLSASGPGEIRALGETQVCKFCHVPHTPVVKEPLWGHALSEVTEYQTSKLRRGTDGGTPAPQPDGVSRLCLSCHDGTIALGDLGRSRKPIRTTGAAHLRPGRRGYLGTDLSGAHPISFVMGDVDADPIEPSDVRLRTVSEVQTDPDVRLDENGKIQCTTCHDPHSDNYFKDGEVPRFWVKPTITEVCVVCHELS